jgi:hypothetical protein
MSPSRRRQFLIVDLSVVGGVVIAVVLFLLLVSHSPVSYAAPARPRAASSRPTIRAVRAAASKTVVPTPAAPAVPVVRAPLTGLPVTPADAANVSRRAVAVKIDGLGRVPNVYGVESADLIFEELVEGGLTRMAVVFQSNDAVRVGPVRSVRTSDFQVLGGLSRPVLVFSGGNPRTVGAAAVAPVLPFPPLSVDGHNVFWRDPHLEAPHNLFTSTAGVYGSVESGTPPSPQFDYLPDGVSATAGAPATAASITFSGATTTSFVWSPSIGKWSRGLDGHPQLDGTGQQLVVDNVVIAGTPYGVSPFERISPEAHPVGSGPVWVLTNGRVQTGTWSRPTNADRWQLLDGVGQPIRLTPGRTWVELPPSGSPVSVG